MLRGFAPVFAPDARVLVLGSLPGAQSLALGQYYGNSRNQFWQLIGAAAGLNLLGLDYPERLTALTGRGIALWDVVAAGRRAGSLDAALRIAERADLDMLLGQLPDLRLVAFNGALAARQAPPLPPHLAALALPSSSPANCTRLSVKQEAWNRLADYLTPAEARIAGKKKARQAGP